MKTGDKLLSSHVKEFSFCLLPVQIQSEFVNADNSLTVSLEEFGLSQYEARAYFAMIAKGPVSAGELAYYSELPRTKVYPTLQKLRKKKLATISDTKPIMCAAIAPEEAFDPIIQEQINKVNAMNSLVANLKTVSEESRKSVGVEERRYHHLTLGNVPKDLRAMIDGARESMRIVVDRSAIGLLTECGKQIAAAVRRGVEVRMIVPPSEAGARSSISIPACAGVRMLESTQSCFIRDDTGVLVVDGRGAGDIFSQTGVLGSTLARSFEGQWERAVPADALLDMTGSESEEVYRAIVILDRDGLAKALDAVMVPGDAPDMAGLLEEGGVPVHSRTLSDLVDLADGALQAACGGRARMDTAGGVLSLESVLGHGHMLAWASVLRAYLQNKGYTTRTIPQESGGSRKVHIRLGNCQEVVT